MSKEFDSELANILDYLRYQQEWIETKHENYPHESGHVNECIVRNKMKTLEKLDIEAIKKIIEKYIIDSGNTYDAHVSTLWNNLREEQRKKLWREK